MSYDDENDENYEKYKELYDLLRKQRKEQDAFNEKRLIAIMLLDELKIAHSSTHIEVIDLYELLMDQNRLEEIVQKMKLKAFW